MRETRCERCAAMPAGAGDPAPSEGCRWCGGPARWSWSFTGEPHADLGAWRLQDDWRVCDTCHALTRAGDDAAVLDRVLVARAGYAAYPYATAFVRELEAARIAHWILRRTTYRRVPSGSVHVTTGRS